MDELDREYVWSKFKKSQPDSGLRVRNGTKTGRAIVFDPSTGLDNEAIKAGVMDLAASMEGSPHPIVKARAFEYVARNLRIDVSPRDWFVSFGCWDRYDRPLSPLVAKWELEVDSAGLKTAKILEALNKSGAAAIWKDFDHSVPDWDAILSLGFPGLRERARRYRREREALGETTPDAQAYFEGIEISYSAILETLDRFRAYALAKANGEPRMLACANCLASLVRGAPSDTYEALQLIYLYFMFSEHIDRFQTRSLGNLDRIIHPYYAKDLEEGRYSEAQVREFFDFFLMQWASIDNYWGQPLYLGGTKENGQSEVNELSYLLLDEYDKLAICTPKVQLKISSNTPRAFLDKALDMVRRGRSSVVFLGEESIKRALIGLGATEAEARTCDISGCYEFSPRGKSNGTTAGHVNMLKPIELVFNDGVDPSTGIDLGVRAGSLESLKSFEDFFAAYLKQLDNVLEGVMRCAADMERHLSWISPANVFSATVEHSLKIARDAFQDGAVYNLSGILQAGFANAVDALAAVRNFVYERKELSLSQFKSILECDWQGSEKFRLRITSDRDKFGNGIDAVDRLAEELACFLSSKINKRPNGRNGVFMASMHSARTYITLGERTGATPDGRLAGEEMSKNVSPAMGMDVNGVTALVKSATRIDSALFPGDFPLDVMMHPATVQGEDGLDAMRILLRTYFGKRGIAMHFNVFDAKTLVDAQLRPEKYQGLQVRVCGWNVNFTELCRKEQDMFIRRAQSISERV